MKNRNIIIALIVIVILLVILVIFFNHKFKNPHKKLKNDYDRIISDGENVEEAIEHYRNIQRPNANDNFHMGEIMHRIVRNIPTAITLYAQAMNNIRQRNIDPQQETADFLVVRFVNGFDDLGVQIENNFMNELMAEVNEDKKEEVKKQNPKSKQDFAEKFINKSTTYTSDSQNVHSRSVNECTKNIYSQIQKPPRTQEETLTILDEIQTKIKREKNEKIRNNAQRTLDTITATNGSITSLGTTELNVLMDVWERSKHPDNKDNKKKIQDNIIMNLHNSVENNNVVCITGRTDEIVSSLVLLDANKDFVIKTEDMYRDEILSTCSKLLNDSIKILKDENTELGKSAKSFSEGTTDDTSLFENHMKKKFEEYITQNYSDKLGENVLKKIITDANSAVSY
jgi:hypothetical protein